MGAFDLVGEGTGGALAEDGIRARQVDQVGIVGGDEGHLARGPAEVGGRGGSDGGGGPAVGLAGEDLEDARADGVRAAGGAVHTAGDRDMGAEFVGKG